jgi:hypothetical protein
MLLIIVAITEMTSKAIRYAILFLPPLQVYFSHEEGACGREKHQKRLTLTLMEGCMIWLERRGKHVHVGELAKQTGASIRSLHYYEQMGVLHASRQENGYRCSDLSAIAQVRRVRSLLSLGFSLEDIHLLAPC